MGERPTLPAPATAVTKDTAAAGATTTVGSATVAGASKQPFYRRKWFIICQLVTAIIGIVILFVLLFPVVRAIAQLLVNKSQLNIETAAIVGPQNTTLVTTTFMWHVLTLPIGSNCIWKDMYVA